MCTKAEDALTEHPVVIIMLKAITISGSQIETFSDLASNTNYITNDAADRFGLHGETIKLVVHGIGGMEKTVTKRYSLWLKLKTLKGKVSEHKILCYGLENSAEVTQAVSPKQLQNVSSNELVRPTKIDLLISLQEGRLVPQPTKIVGYLVLWGRPLGKTVGGTHPNLFEAVDLAVLPSDTHLTRSMRTAPTAYKETIFKQRREMPQPEALQPPTKRSSIDEVQEWTACRTG